MHDQPAAPEVPLRRFRKLRIAWSVAWGVVALLLIVLWMQSYWHHDGLLIRTSGNNFIQLGSENSKLSASWGYGDRPLEKLVSFHTGLIAAMSRVRGETLDQDKRPVYRGMGFKVIRWANGAGYVLPIWFLLLSATFVGSLPWLRWRFSLRTLLIAMTLIAVGLGTIVWLTQAG
jgi:hypothetical protein